MINDKLTYVSLFSSAGVGCFGFKKAGFDCIATNELLEKRLNIQKINKKCKYDSGYINGDITKEEIKEKIFKEIDFWKNNGNDRVDVVIATPPCQGMSIANRKKNENDINRNSLVVESIHIIKKVKPRFFVFENVPAFMKSTCVSSDNIQRTIEETIKIELGSQYSYIHKVINFKNYGSNSSRTRTLVIGVSKELANDVSLLNIFPLYQKENTIKEVIGHLKELEWGEIDKDDCYHQFRTYDKKMLPWISDLAQGKSAFDNEDITTIPHKIVNNELVPNSRKVSGKYTRNSWDKIAACIHTRNDQLSSQSTIHPTQNRVFSIRELMLLMTIPYDFKWIDLDNLIINSMSFDEKQSILKKNEITIRQSIGESVPTNIFFQIAENISKYLSKDKVKKKNIYNIIEQNNLTIIDNMKVFINENNSYGFDDFCEIIEYANQSREKDSAFFTNNELLNEIYCELPDVCGKSIRVLEPSVGVGKFIPYILDKYQEKEHIELDIIDINSFLLDSLNCMLNKFGIKKNVKINIINKDFFDFTFNKKYDLIVGNPPFGKASVNQIKSFDFKNKKTKNLAALFFEKTFSMSDYVVLVLPKNILNTSEFETTRTIMENYSIDKIIDFGECGFKNVLVETVCVFIDKSKKPNTTKVISKIEHTIKTQNQKYITSKEFPYWIIYRNDFFDEIAKKLEFNIFNSIRDRQITNNMLVKKEDLIQEKEYVKVLKSRNMSNDGQNFIEIDNYDSYIEKLNTSNLLMSKFIDEPVFITPNMTYNTRVGIKPKGILINGSFAILTPINEYIEIKQSDLLYYSSIEFREFYKIARNLQTRSLNIDKNSVFFFGIKLQK